MVPITPLSIGGYAGQSEADSPQHGCPIHTIEGILKINGEESFVDMPRIAVELVAGSVHSGFCTKGDSYSKLQGGEPSLSRFADSLAEALGG